MFDDTFIDDEGLTTAYEPAILSDSGASLPHVVVPTTFHEATGQPFVTVYPDGTTLYPAPSRVGVHEVVYDAASHDWYDAWVVWDGAAPERLTHGTPGHSKGLLLEAYFGHQHLIGTYERR